MSLHPSPDHTTPGSSVEITVDPVDEHRTLTLDLLETQIEPQLDDEFGVKVYRREVLSVPVAAGAETATLVVPPDLPPSYRGTTIGWSYEAVLDDDAVEIVIDWSVEAAAGEPVLDGPLSGSRTWVARGAEPTGGVNRLTVLGSAGLGVLLLVVAITNASIFAMVLGVALLAIGLWFGRDIVVQLRHSLREVTVVAENAIVTLGEPVVVEIDPDGREGVEVGLVAVELTMIPHRQTIVRETGIERWATAEVGANELPTSLDDPPSYQGERIALHWYLALRDITLPTTPQLLTQRREPLILHHQTLPPTSP